MSNVDHDREPLPLFAIGVLITLAVFMFGAWGYFTKGEVFSGGEAAAGYVLAAVLGGIMQGGAAYGAKALRRSKNFKLDASKILSGAMVATGAIFTGYTVHNAFEVTGMLEGGEAAAMAWLVSFGVPVFEFSVWWVDESLKSEAQALRAEDEDKRLEETRGVLWSDVTALDPETLPLLAATDADSFERVRAWASKVFGKANHIANPRTRKASTG